VTPRSFTEVTSAPRVSSPLSARARALHFCSPLLAGVAAVSVLLSCGTAAPAGPVCDTRTVRLDGACVPSASSPLAAGQALLVQVREGCGSACGKNSVFMCTGALDGGTLVLTALLNECRDSETTCPAVCRQATIDCIVPALNPGTYPMVGEGLSAAGSLVITADAGSVSCRL